MNKEAVAYAVPGIGERHRVHIMNPASGNSKKFKKAYDAVKSLGEEVFLTECEKTAEDFVAELLAKDPEAHVVAHGGDGTMCETVGGIMAAGAGKTALFTGIPSGSGNDFLRYTAEKMNAEGEIYPTDLILANGKYSVNIINMGFDCTVVSEAEKIRKLPGIGGSFSYICGVVSALMKKKAFSTSVVMKDVVGEDGELHDETQTGDFLLAAIANGRYYGGGFKVAPLAEADDGFIDLLTVKAISVPNFVKLVSGFRKGTHLDADGNVIPKFKEFLSFRRCRKVSLGGIKEVCYDGEILKMSDISAEIVPKAVLYTPAKKEWLV